MIKNRIVKYGKLLILTAVLIFFTAFIYTGCASTGDTPVTDENAVSEEAAGCRREQYPGRRIGSFPGDIS